MQPVATASPKTIRPRYAAGRARSYGACTRSKGSARSEPDDEGTHTKENNHMPFIDIKVIEGVFTPEEQRELVEKVTEAVVSVEGEALRPFTHTAITETPSGSWAIGGQALATGDVLAKRAAGAAA
jgi:4-oxalocrotonate tautomerase